MITPNHKQRWCEALPTKMRLLGWPEEACTAAWRYVDSVRQVFTGRAWYTYTKEVETFLRTRTSRTPQELIAYFPRRMAVGRNLAISA